MKKYVSVLLVVLVIFAFNSSVFSQVVKFKSDCDSDKKEDKNEDSDSKKESKTMSSCGGNEDISFKGYEDDPLYKKMMELKKKADEAMKASKEKAKEVYEKYGNWNELSEDDQKKMSEELNAIYEEYKKASSEYQKVRGELIEKILKERAEKYKDNPLYQKMIDAKKKMDEEQKKFMVAARDLAMTYGGNWNEMTEEKRKEYYEKMNELKKPYDEAKDDYKKAKKAFEDSIDEKTEDEEEDK